MSKPKRSDNSAEMCVEVVHISTPDAAARIRNALEVILTASCRDRESGGKSRVEADSNPPGDGSSSGKSKGVGP